MAAKTAKTTELTPEPVTTSLTDLTSLNLEDLLADSLLESIDWSKVKALMIEKAQSKFWAWISSVSPASDVSLALLPDAIAIGAIGEVNND